MGQRLRKNIAASTKRICARYSQISNSLSLLSATNVELEQFLAHLNSTLSYCQQHFGQVSTIDLTDCRQRHEPVLLLNNVELAFNNLEQGFYHLYPTPQYGQTIQALFKANEPDFADLEKALAAIV
jgi:hypothetical protein